MPKNNCFEEMAWRQTPLLNRNLLSLLPFNSNTFFSRYSSKSNTYPVKVGIPEFLNGIGNGVETYAEKLESEFGDLQNLLVARSMKLKKLNVGGDPKVCRHVQTRSSRDQVQGRILMSFSMIPFILDNNELSNGCCLKHMTFQALPTRGYNITTNQNTLMALFEHSSFQQKRKLILKYAHKYRLGLWRPRAEPPKTNK